MNARVVVVETAANEKEVFVKVNAPPRMLFCDAIEVPPSPAPSKTTAFTEERVGKFAVAQNETS